MSRHHCQQIFFAPLILITFFSFIFSLYIILYAVDKIFLRIIRLSVSFLLLYHFCLCCHQIFYASYDFRLVFAICLISCIYCCFFCRFAKRGYSRRHSIEPEKLKSHTDALVVRGYKTSLTHHCVTRATSMLSLLVGDRIIRISSLRAHCTRSTIPARSRTLPCAISLLCLPDRTPLLARSHTLHTLLRDRIVVQSRTFAIFHVFYILWPLLRHPIT